MSKERYLCVEWPDTTAVVNFLDPCGLSGECVSVTVEVKNNKVWVLVRHTHESSSEFTDLVDVVEDLPDSGA